MACPLEGLVRRGASPQITFADLGLTSNTHAASATSIALAVNFRPKAEITFKIVSKLGLRSPESALYRLSRDKPALRAI